MAEAQTLECPRCGAPADPTETACRYCASVLALIACPSCFAKIFEGAKHCPHCGQAVGRKDASSAPVGPCPRCHGTLAPVAVGTATLHECRNCGVWIDPETFERICSETDEQTFVMKEVLPTPPHEGSSAPVGKPLYCPCPVCGRLMNRQNFAHISGVIVSACKGHGVWFDHDSLHRIVGFIKSGGLVRAREAEKLELEAQRQRLKDLQRDIRIKEATGPNFVDDTGVHDYALIFRTARDLLKHFFS